ncbi:MAG: hypothetical protein ACRENS_03075 [Candidatus Eiseniibacteriota bacterium]
MSEPGGLTPQHEERLARYRAGAMGDSERAAFEGEALADDALFEALYREGALDALLPIGATAPQASASRAESAKREKRVRERRTWWGMRGSQWAWSISMGVVIGAAFSLLVVRRPSVRPGTETLRGGQTSLILLEPVGPVSAAPGRFRWTRQAGAASYRVELFDRRGTRLGTVVTADTSLSVEAFTTTRPREGQWRVVPLGADGLDRHLAVRAVFEVAP